MSVEENKALVLRYYEATHNRHDLGVIDETCEREYGRSRRGFFEMAYAAFPDLHTSVEGVIAEGDKVMVYEIVRGTHRGEFPTPLGPVGATGKEVTFSAVLIYRVVDGKIVEEKALLDWLALLQQFGAIPSRAS